MRRSPFRPTSRVLYVATTRDIAIAVSKFVAAALTGSSTMPTEGVHPLLRTRHRRRRGRGTQFDKSQRSACCKFFHHRPRRRS